MSGVKALSMFSGGLDSILATKLLLAQELEVEAINFSGFFCSCKQGGGAVANAAKKLGVPLKTVCVGNEYLRMVRNPKHGYGRHMNPCVDCKIFMLKEAKKFAKTKHSGLPEVKEAIDAKIQDQPTSSDDTVRSAQSDTVKKQQLQNLCADGLFV